jgi:hypothetical protein
MNSAASVQLEHPAQKEQPNANRATKESSTTNLAVPVKTVYQKRFRTKVPKKHAWLVREDGCNRTKVRQPASASIGKRWKVAKKVNI